MNKINKQNQSSGSGKNTSSMEYVEEAVVDIAVDEGREVVDREGTPKAGYSAYGLCVKASESNNNQM